jgi:hypothetical protein
MKFLTSLVVVAAAVVALGAGRADAGNVPGVTDTEIHIGQWGPQTGPAAPWGAVARGTEVLFQMINDAGGIHGRKIVYHSFDDQYNPARTKAGVKELVESDPGVFAFVGGVGSATGMAVKDYLNERGIVWVGPAAGSLQWITPPQKNLFAVYPLYVEEAKVLVDYLVEKEKKSKIAILYADDEYGENGLALSCSHDANAWPADYFAGMPAPAADERLILHIQNSHPVPIPSGSVGLGIMGGQQVSLLERDIAPFATYSLDIADLLPDAKWPDQIEIHAGRYFVRPRYEIVRKDGRRRIAHANVERTDLQPNPEIAALSEVMGKGYIMPLPVLPVDEFSSTILPTPMATGQMELPVRADLYDMNGECIARHFMGRLQRRDSMPLALDDWLAEAGASLPSGAGHVELVYDFRDGGEADGWLHALGQYTQRASGHMAETIFGAHIYNTPIIYKDEPQSYTGSPPGLTTRLFLRVGQNFEPGTDGLCHLIYPASMPWHPESDTRLILHDGNGKVVAEQHLQIACGGSRFWRFSELFSQRQRAAAGADAYVIIRDTTCRLFGFHGLQQGEQGFCLDHMFGF